MGIYNFICGPRSYDAFPKWPARSFGLATPALEAQSYDFAFGSAWVLNLVISVKGEAQAENIGPSRDEMRGEKRKLRNEELRVVCRGPLIIFLCFRCLSQLKCRLLMAIREQSSAVLALTEMSLHKLR
jgi:hypothetical protein